MATTIRQMILNAAANPATVTCVIQKGVGPYPLPGMVRADSVTAANNGGAVYGNTDPLWDKKFSSHFDMPRFAVFDSGVVYYPVCISQHEPYLHRVNTTSTAYTTGGGGAPIHIITDLGFAPWKAYQGPVQGRLNDLYPY